jgi:transcription initiation factor TFIID subunit TAF12
MPQEVQVLHSSAMMPHGSGRQQQVLQNKIGSSCVPQNQRGVVHCKTTNTSKQSALLLHYTALDDLTMCTCTGSASKAQHCRQALAQCSAGSDAATAQTSRASLGYVAC